MNKKFLLSSLIASAILSSQASAELITVYTGNTNGHYHNVIGKSLKKELEAKGHEVKLIPSKGTNENINKVNQSKVANTIGIAQAGEAKNIISIISKFLKNNKATMNGNLGYECGFFISRNENTNSLKDLKGLKVAVGEKGSSSFVTYKNLTPLNNDMIIPRLKARGDKSYIDKVDNKSYGGYFFMSIPDVKNQQIADVVDNKNLDFLSLHDLKLGELGKGDNPLYTKISLPIEKNTPTGKIKQSAEAICTHTTLVLNKKLTKDKVLSDILEASKKVKTNVLNSYGFSSSWLNKSK